MLVTRKRNMLARVQYSCRSPNISPKSLELCHEAISILMTHKYLEPSYKIWLLRQPARLGFVHSGRKLRKFWLNLKILVFLSHFLWILNSWIIFVKAWTLQLFWTHAMILFPFLSSKYVYTTDNNQCLTHVYTTDNNQCLTHVYTTDNNQCLTHVYTTDNNQCLTHAEISNRKNYKTQWRIVMFKSAITCSAYGHFCKENYLSYMNQAVIWIFLFLSI